mmetsp:Transcript_13888/g.23707  ORF Transcript_13888/g.23707 Transcript_13888/m.23707 type:complete len:679 (-) Transcript_13888:135-2171(-)
MANMETRAEQILNIMKETTPSTMPTFKSTSYELKQQQPQQSQAQTINDPVLAEHLSRRDATLNLPEHLGSERADTEPKTSKVEQIARSFQEAVPMETGQDAGQGKGQDTGSAKQEGATLTSLPEPTTAEGFVGIAPQSDRPLAANIAEVQKLRQSEYQLPSDQHKVSETLPSANVGVMPWEADVMEKTKLMPEEAQQFEAQIPATYMTQPYAGMATGQSSDESSLSQSQFPRAEAPIPTMPDVNVDVRMENMEATIPAGGLGDGAEQVLPGVQVASPAKVDTSEDTPMEISDSITQTGLGDGNEQVAAGRSASLQGAGDIDRQIQGERPSEQGVVEISDDIARKGLGDGAEQVPQGGASSAVHPMKSSVEALEPGFVIPVPGKDTGEWFEVSELGGDQEGAPISQRLGMSSQAPLAEKVEESRRTMDESARDKLVHQTGSSSSAVPEKTSLAPKQNDMGSGVSEPQDIKEMIPKKKRNCETVTEEQQPQTEAPSNLQQMGEKSEQPSGKTVTKHVFRENVEELKEKVAMMASGIRESLPNPFARTTGIQARKHESPEDYRTRQAEEEAENRGYEDIYQAKLQGVGSAEPPSSEPPMDQQKQQVQMSDISKPYAQGTMPSIGETKEEHKDLPESIMAHSKNHQDHTFEQVASAQESAEQQARNHPHVKFAKTVFPGAQI